MEAQRRDAYFAGIMAGILAVLSALLTTAILGRTLYFGESASYLQAAGFIADFFFPGELGRFAAFDWQFSLVGGMAVGAFLSAGADDDFKVEWVPPIWRERFGPSIPKRAVGGFLGGFLMLLGGCLAGGCVNGHGLSGMMQLSLSSLVSLLLFAASGALVAHILYDRGEL